MRDLSLLFGRNSVYTRIMEFDVLASIGLTACAAVAVSALAIGLGQSAVKRTLLGAAFAAWFFLVTLLGATQALHFEHGIGVPGLGIAVLLPIVILGVSVLRSAALRRALLAMPLSLLIGVNTIRILGVVFLILYGAGRLPAPFAPSAGWGDIIVGLAAGPLAWLAHKKPAAAAPAVWLWNAFGLIDLIIAVGLGVTSSPGPLRLIFAEPGTAIMTSLPWLLIPGFLVPLLASTHLAIFYRLAKDRIQEVDSNTGGLKHRMI